MTPGKLTSRWNPAAASLRTSRASRWRPHLLLLLLALLSAQRAGAQVGGMAPPNAAPGAPAGSYSLSGFESVNLFNGNLNFSLPLFVVGGRGATRFPLTLTVNNARWKMDREGVTVNRSKVETGHQGSVYVITAPSYEVWDPDSSTLTHHANGIGDMSIILDGTMTNVSGETFGSPIYYHPNPDGWFRVDPGYGPGIMQGRILTRASRTLGPRLARLVFTAPDGSEYELRDRLTGGAPDMSTNQPKSRGNVFVSADGSATTFISDAAITDSWPEMNASQSPKEEQLYFFNPSGFLLFADGACYRIDAGLVSWERDRNGNVIRFAYDAERRMVRATDPAGRELIVWYEGTTDPATGVVFDHDEIRFTGAGGQPRAVKVWHSDLRGALRSDYPDALSYGQLFGTYDLYPGEAGTVYNPARLVRAVELPGGRSYQLSYDPYGQVARVVLPTGGAVEYDYAEISSQLNIQMRVKERRLYADRLDSVPEKVETYRVSYSDPLTPPRTSIVTVEQKRGGDGKVLAKSRHHFHGHSNSFQAGAYSPWNEGREFKTELLDPDRNDAVLRGVNQTWQQRPTASATEKWWTFGDGPPLDPRLVETLTALENGLASRSTSIDPNDPGRVGFDRYNNRTDLWEYDYRAAGEPWRLLRHTHTKYLTINPVRGVDYACDPDAACNVGAAAAGVIHLRRLPEEEWVNEEAGAGNKRSLTRHEYDNYTADATHTREPLAVRPDISGLCLTLDANMNCARASDAGFLTRGNPTAMTSYLLSNTGAELGSVVKFNQYDVAGNVIRSIDARGHATEFIFEDNFGSPNDSALDHAAPAGLQGRKSYAFVTQVRNALGHAVYSQYDYFTGAVVNFEDANGTVTRLTYGAGDPHDRLTQVVRAANYPDRPDLRAQTTYAYDDANHTVTTTSDLRAYGDNLLKSASLSDGWGRATETRQYETPAQYVSTLTKYDALGRISAVSNPHRPGSESPAWTTTEFDALGRGSTVTTPDGAKAYTLYDGARSLSVDQTGRQRITKKDALGRLSDVWEITAADPSTEQATFPVPQNFPHPAPASGYRTSYGHDVLGNLRRIEQGVQRRYFAYNSLGQMIRASQPEQEVNAALALPSNMLNWAGDGNNNWSLGFEYDENGNLRKRTDARGVETSHVYDPLNRLTDRNYTGIQLPQGGTLGTPSVRYYYDGAQGLPAGAQSFTPGKATGRLVAVVYGGANSAAGTYTGGYDEIGRARYSAQVTAAVDLAGQPATTTHAFGYDYWLDGSLKSETYPSGRVVDFEYDTSSRPAGVRRRGGDYYAGGDPTLPNNPNVIAYTAHGAAAAVRLGNGLWEHTLFNSRLQPVEIGLGASRTESSKLKLEYGYGLAPDGSPDPTLNNGNVRTQKISVPAEGLAPARTLTQTYSYDALNRLEAAAETDGAVSTWAQLYAYDRYGNRRLDPSQTTWPKLTQPGQTESPEVASPSTLPLTNRMAEDQDGDGDREYAYDKVGNVTCDVGHCTPASSPAAYYEFDGESRMVRVGGGAQSGGADYAYDGEGRRVKKVWGTQVTIFIYDSGGRLAAEYSNQVEANGTRYSTQDQLGSTRVVTDAQGNAHANGGARGSRHDYLPFGEAIVAGIGGRTTTHGYVGDKFSQKFTGKIRDGETGLDYFLARYYSSSQGRFNSPDPIVISDRQTLNPQLWNLYNYAGNNPLAYTDPTGMERVRLGQHTDEQIKQRQQEIDQELKDKTLTRAQKEALRAERRTLDLERQGNEIVGEYLGAIETIGARKGFKVSDFTLSTDSANDFKGVVSGDPGASGAMFVLVGYSREIFINTNSNDWKRSTGALVDYDSKGNAIARTDFIIYGGTAAVHERSHRDSPTRALQSSEGRAYTEQLRVLQKFGPDAFKSKEFYKRAVTHVSNGAKLP